MKFIYTTLGYNSKGSKPDKYVDVLSDRQFESFAAYMNNYILKKMGYLGCSRLGLCINNAKKVLEKLKDYKGMSCGVEFKI